MTKPSLVVGEECGDIGGLQHGAIQANMINRAGEPAHPGVAGGVALDVVGFLVTADYKVAAIAVEGDRLVGFLVELYAIPVHGAYKRGGIIGEGHHMPVAIIHVRPSCRIYVVRKIPIVAVAVGEMDFEVHTVGSAAIGIVGIPGH